MSQAELELRMELARTRTFLWRVMPALDATGARPDLVARFKSMFIRRPCRQAPAPRAP